MVVRNPNYFNIMPLDLVADEPKFNQDHFGGGDEYADADLLPELYPSEDSIMNDDVEFAQTMSIGEQEELCQRITKLSGENLLALKTLIKNEDPKALRYENAQWEFDTSTMKPETVRKIRDFVDNALEIKPPTLFSTHSLSLVSEPSWSSSWSIPRDFTTESSTTTTPQYLKMKPEHPAPSQAGAGAYAPYQYPQAAEAMEPEQHRPRPRTYTENFAQNSSGAQGAPRSASADYTPAFTRGYEYEPLGPEQSAPRSDAGYNLRPAAMDVSHQEATTEMVEEPPAPVRAPATATQKPKRIRAATGPSLSRGELLETISNIKVYRPLDTPGKKKGIRFMCDACGKGFRKRSEVVVHIRVHTGERPLQCSMCDRRFAHPSNLHAHERRHPEAKSLACTVPGCSETFADQARLRNHMLAHQQSVFACAQCSQRFKTKLRLESHVAQHH